MNVAAIVLQIILGVFFLGAGGSKIAGAETQVKSFDQWRLPQWFRPIVGAIEIIGAAGLLVGVAVHWVGTLAAFWLIGLMLGALLTHIRIRDTAQHFAIPIAVLCVTAVIAALRVAAAGGHIA